MNYEVLKLNTSTSVSDVTTGITNIADILNNYGPLITIASIFIILFILMAAVMVYLFVLLYKERLKEKKEDDSLKDASNKLLVDMLTKLSDQMTNNQTTLQNKVEALSNTTPPKSNNNLVGVYIDVNMAFKDASRMVFDVLNVDRIAIYVFHNGNKSTHGLPFFKMSCIHEWNRNKGFNMRGKAHTDLPLHVYSDMVETLYRDSEYFISDINKEKLDDYSMREFVFYSNSKSLFALAIKDELDNLCGFSIVEFNNPTDFSDEKVYDKVKDTLEIMNGSIKYIVANNDFREKYNGNN